MNIFTINNSTINPSNTKTYVQGGIQDNLKLVEVKFQTVESTGNQFLAFKWENQQGNPLNYTFWQPKPSKPIEAMSAEEKRVFLEFKVGYPMGILRQLIEVYKGKIDWDKENLSTNTFKEFADKIVALLGDSYKDKLVRIKVVYDNKGFTTLPKDPKFPFIESMDVPKEDTSIQIIEGKDVIVRPQMKGDVEIKEENPLNETFTAPTKTDEIPF
jgi:hypothetical protein